MSKKKLAVLFLLKNSSKKFSTQKRSSSQVLKPFFMDRTYAASPPTWKCFTSNALTVKYELSIYVTRTVAFLLQNNL